jgi:peroxiredoxin Q/BCP
MPHAARRLRIAGLIAGALLAFALATPVAALQVGEKAPDFTLPGSKGQPVKLSELTAKGPVVLYTFIQAFTNT